MQFLTMHKDQERRYRSVEGATRVCCLWRTHVIDKDP